MKKGTIITLAVVVILLILCGTGCNRYNAMVEAEQDVEQAWGNVQTSYQRRSDLIPNLVNTVKGYATHESTTLENVTHARAGLLSASATADSLANAQPSADEASMKRFAQAQQRLNSALNVYVNAVHEAYPDLKANENFMNLQTQLEGTENRISIERRRYNEVVRPYNTMIRRFPNNIFASMFGFDKKPYYEADENAQQAPQVQF